MDIRLRPLVSFLAAIAVAVLALAGPFLASAQAAWPGREGPVVYAGLDPGQRPHPFIAAGLRAVVPGVLGSRTQLTTDPSDLDPQVSPDGRLVVFSRTVRTLATGPVSGLFVIGIDGSGLRQLTEGGSDDSSDIQPTFFPSGERIAFVRGESDIYSVGLDGSGLRPIASDDAQKRSPAVSPNGRQIVYECSETPRQPLATDKHICSIRPNGSGRRDLTPRFEGTQEAFDPDFSPSGRTIAFTLGPGTAADVFTMRPNGSRLGALTNRGPSGRRTFPRDLGYADPAFSPAGGSIVAVARGGAGPRLVRIRLDDPRNPRPLGGGLLGRSPAWAPSSGR